MIINKSINFSSDTLVTKNLRAEIESLLIAAENNAIRTNYNKVKIDNMQQNSECRLWGDKEETDNRIIIEYK